MICNTLEDNGFRESQNDKLEQHIVWSNCSVSSVIFGSLQRNQRINHFPSSNELTRKDNMFKNVQRMQHNFGRKGFDFLPQTYVMPTDSTTLISDMYKHPDKWYIVKPTNMSQGKGI